MHKQLSSRQKGDIAEELVRIFITKNSDLKIIKSNSHHRFGELDIIASDKNEIVFIEVKAHFKDLGFHPLEAISYQKLQRIRKSANIYLLKNNLEKRPFRIDAIGTIIIDGEIKDLEWIKNI